MEMIWEEPPARRDASSRSGRVDAMLAELKKHPGQWAVVSEFRGGGNTSIWKKRGCEATTRRDAATGLTKTYARWPQDASAAGEVPAADSAPRTDREAVGSTRPKGITPADVEAMAELRAQGWSFTSIGEKFGISRVMAGKHVRRYEEAIEQDPEARADDEGPAPTLGSIRRATLVAQHTKGTCRTCGSRNRGLTDGVCRMCTIRAQEKAALKDGADA